jgi:hypothetical protein
MIYNAKSVQYYSRCEFTWAGESFLNYEYMAVCVCQCGGAGGMQG